MKAAFLESPRRFDPEGRGRFCISDVGTMELAADEQITFVAETGSEYDVVRKSWGYYATPSLDTRLPAKGLRPALARNAAGRYYVCLVEKNGKAEFERYLEESEMIVVAWLDDPPTLARLDAVLRER